MKQDRYLNLIGSGMGVQLTMTKEALLALEKAEVIFGAKRMLEDMASLDIPCIPAYQPDQILEYLSQHPKIIHAAVLFSGDTGFFSGAFKVLEQCREDFTVKIYPGLSTVSYFAAKLGLSWEGFHLCSLHGREYNLVGALLRYPNVFVLFENARQLREQVAELEYYGLSKVQMAVGSNLGMQGESFREKIHDFAPIGCYGDFKEEGLHVAILRSYMETPLSISYGIPDECFYKEQVPMTKEEVRCISISKLQLQEDSILFDIGAGCGSVGIECARLAWKGQVHAFEKKEAAISCLKINRQKFQAANLTIHEGEASVLLLTKPLPVPTHAFLGGTGGKLFDILDTLLEMNPRIQLVANIVTLESLQQWLEYGGKKGLSVQYTQIFASRAREAKGYHLMQAQNPVMVLKVHANI